MVNSFSQFFQLLRYNFPSWLFLIFTVFCLLLYYRYYIKVSMPLAGTTEWITRIIERPVFTLHFRRHPMSRKDLLPMLLITVVYGATAFIGLGDFTNPQSFFRFTNEKQSVVLTLSEPTDIGSLMYYPGLWIGGYTLEFSGDGVNWQQQYPAEGHESAMDQPHSDLFKWLHADINKDNIPTTYIRISTTSTPLELGEIALYAKHSKQPIPAASVSCPDAPQLFDEQNIVPSAPSYMNSMYFDEIYHGRTAYEYIENIQPYETTHPPLGKLIITLGVELFGMVPFGWRFMGTLFGVLMLPILYIFIKNMFGKTVIAACGTTLFAFDFMHFVQTRIATIDTYGVFFILVTYYFMYRYITLDPETPFRKTLPPLLLSGTIFRHRQRVEMDRHLRGLRSLPAVHPPSRHERPALEDKRLAGLWEVPCQNASRHFRLLRRRPCHHLLPELHRERSHRRDDDWQYALGPGLLQARLGKPDVHVRLPFQAGGDPRLLVHVVPMDRGRPAPSCTTWM